MIGHWLLQLTAEQENRVLTQAFERVTLQRRDDAELPPAGCQCLVLTATDGKDFIGGEAPAGLWRSPGYVYENLARRFGEARVNPAIRQRILTNRLWRTLGQAKQQVEEAVGARA